MSIHFHAFLPPRKLMPLSDPETFKPREFGLHVIALPDESADRAKSADSAELAPPAGSAEPVEPIEFAEPAAPVESAAAAQSAHLAQPAQRKRPSQPSLDDSGSLPLRRSRRLQASGESLIPSRPRPLAMLYASPASSCSRPSAVPPCGPRAASCDIPDVCQATSLITEGIQRNRCLAVISLPWPGLLHRAPHSSSSADSSPPLPCD